MEPEVIEKPKVNLKRLLITVGIVLITAAVVGGGVWYVMDQSIKKETEEAATATQNQGSTVVNKTKSAITVIDNNWNLYTNYEKGYSIKVPVSANNFEGACEWVTKDGDNSYRPKEAVVPVKVFEKNGVVIIDFEYSYKLTEEIVLNSGVHRYGNCEKVVNTFDTVNIPTAMSWRIKTASVNTEAELSNFFQKYGEACKPGERKSVADGLYRISIEGDGLNLDETKCPVNYATAIFYSTTSKKVYYWDLGQQAHFYQDGYADYSDDEMVGSFKVL